MRRRSILSNHYIFTSSPPHTPLFYATGREFCRVDDDEDDDDVILDYYPGSFFGTTSTTTTTVRVTKRAGGAAWSPFLSPGLLCSLS